MFGYVRPARGELLVKDHEFYRATYCGICRTMKRRTGVFSPMFLTYDSVYLALVRMLFIEDSAFGSRRIRCAAHPLKKRNALIENDALAYTARVFACLSYHRLRDDLADESAPRRMAEGMLMPFLEHGRAKADMKELEASMKKHLAAIRGLEEAGCDSVDLPAEHFGKLLSEVFSYGLSGNDALVTGEIGYHLGKFIYVADAAEDYDKDIKKQRYNPFVLRYGAEPMTDDNRATVHTALLIEAEGIGRAVELLPFGSRATLERIIKNITYLGLRERIKFLEPKEV